MFFSFVELKNETEVSWMLLRIDDMMMRNSEMKIYVVAILGLLIISSTRNCFGFTDPGDSKFLIPSPR